MQEEVIGTRRRFTDESKREAVRLVMQPDMTMLGAARDLGVNSSVLRRWVDDERQGKWRKEPPEPSILGPDH